MSDEEELNLDDDDDQDDPAADAVALLTGSPRVTPPGTTDIGNDRELFDYIMEFVEHYRRIDNPNRVKSLSTLDRFGDLGRREDSLDSFIMELAARAMGSGGDIDGYIAKGGLSRRWVPVARRRVDTQPMVTFRARLVEGDRATPLRFGMIIDRLEQVRRAGGQIVFPDGTNASLTADEVAALNHFLDMDQDEALSYLDLHYGDKLRTSAWVNKWAQVKGNFDPNLAYQGECAWEIALIKGDVNTHRYRLFQTMPIGWVDTFMQWYFDEHPLAVELATLRQLTRDDTRYPLGNGPLRHYGFNELWCQETASQARKDEVAENLRNWQSAWRLRMHVWHAYSLAFELYTERFEHSARAYRELEELYRVHTPNPTAPDQDPLSIVNGTSPYGGVDTNYEGFGTQAPPSVIYGRAWKRTESLIQFKRRLEANESVRGQYLSETVEGIERALDTISWIERSFQIDKDGRRHESWYARTDHDCQAVSRYWRWVKNPRDIVLQTGDSHSYCPECVKWENWKPINRITDEDLAEEFEVIEGGTTVRRKLWEYREVNVEYATRQEEQQWRKIIGTHNRGSAMSGHYAYGNLTKGTVATNRDAYVGGFQESIDGKAWYYPGLGYLTDVRDFYKLPNGTWQIRTRPNATIEWENADVEVADVTHHGIVSRLWWLGYILANRVNTQEQEPFNNDWMGHFDKLVELQDSRHALANFIQMDTTGDGITRDDLHKALEKVLGYNDGFVSPTDNGRVDLGGDRNIFGRKWVDFRPEFDPHHPALQRYGDTAFHIDPQWFEKRNFFSTVIVGELIKNYKRVFGTPYQFTITWPDGETAQVGSFDDPAFEMYLISNWFDHPTLAHDVWYNQNKRTVMESILTTIKETEDDGQSDIRGLVTKLVEGLPPTFDIFRGQLREKADQRFKNRIVQLAEGSGWALGVDFGMITNYVWKNAGGQGYGTPEEQHDRVQDFYMIALLCKWYTVGVGLIRSHAMTPEKEGPIHVREVLAREMQGLNIPWEKALEFADQLIPDWTKLVGLEGRDLIPEKPLHHEQVLKDAFLKELATVLAPNKEESGSTGQLIVEANAHRLVHVLPETPQSLRRTTLDDLRIKAQRR